MTSTLSDWFIDYIAHGLPCRSCGRGVFGFTTPDPICGACAIGHPELRDSENRVVILPTDVVN